MEDSVTVSTKFVDAETAQKVVTVAQLVPLRSAVFSNVFEEAGGSPLIEIVHRLLETVMPGIVIVGNASETSIS